MKIIIFAGGIGTRLWPLSRKNSPKQFDKIFNGKSTLELAIERVEPLVGIDNIFIQTTPEFSESVREHLPALPEKNIFIEPCRRNVGPAVCYGMMRLGTLPPPTPPLAGGGISGADVSHEPVALLWADHLMSRVDEFRSALEMGEELIKKEPDRFIFIAERPRFANNNVGWIKMGEIAGEIKGNDYFKFEGWKYKPNPEDCGQMFKTGDWGWNSGYFVSSVGFILEQYKFLAPKIYDNVKMAIDYPENAFENYERAEKISFDSAVVEKTDLSKAVVIKTNMGWSDPGTLYALKEALENSHEENVKTGEVVELNTKDSLLYNFEQDKLLACVGLDGFVVVNTKDAIIVVPKDEVVHVTKLVETLAENGLGKYC